MQTGLSGGWQLLKADYLTFAARTDMQAGAPSKNHTISVK